jgi:hypothetical protein
MFWAYGPELVGLKEDIRENDGRNHVSLYAYVCEAKSFCHIYIYIYIYIYMESLWTKAHGIKLKKIAMEETTFLCIRGQIFYFILRPNLRSIAGGWKYDSHVDLNYELPIYRYL